MQAGGEITVYLTLRSTEVQCVWTGGERVGLGWLAGAEAEFRSPVARQSVVWGKSIEHLAPNFKCLLKTNMMLVVDTTEHEGSCKASPG